jgi:hypothetical protein
MKRIIFVFVFYSSIIPGQAQSSNQSKNAKNIKTITGRNILCPMIEAKVPGELFKDDSYSVNITFSSKDSTVFSVSDGVVVSVVMIEDMKVVIITKDSLTYTYANLKTTSVKKGDTVKANQVIGYAGLNLDGIIAIDFYLNNKMGSVDLSKRDFIMRTSKASIYFTPMLGMEPE